MWHYRQVSEIACWAREARHRRVCTVIPLFSVVSVVIEIQMVVHLGYGGGEGRLERGLKTLVVWGQCCWSIIFLIWALLCLFNLSFVCSSRFKNSLTAVIIVWICNRLAGPSDVCITSQERENMHKCLQASGPSVVFLCSHHQITPGTSQNESTACLLTY